MSTRHFHYSHEMTRMIITHLSDLQTSTRNDLSVIIGCVYILTRQGSIFDIICTPPLSNHLRLCSNFVSAGHAGLSPYPQRVKFSFWTNSPPTWVNFAWRFFVPTKIIWFSSPHLCFFLLIRLLIYFLSCYHQKCE